MAERWIVSSANTSLAGTWNGGTLPAPGDDCYANGFSPTINANLQVASIRTTAGTTAVAGGGWSISSGVTLTANVIGERLSV